jgi:hypothetical protein
LSVGNLRNCIVKRKEKHCTAFELYEEKSEEFLLSCVYCLSMSPMLLFITLQDAHERYFDELCCNLHVRHYVAKMVPDWITGLHFQLYLFHGLKVCDIK